MPDLTAEALIAVVRGHDPDAVENAIAEVREEGYHPAVQKNKHRGYDIYANSHHAHLQKIRTKHCAIANMHCAGLSNALIAELTGAKSSWIGYVLREPIMKEYIQKHILGNLEEAEQKSKGAMLKAVETVTDTLNAGETRHRLAAAKIVIDMNQKSGVNPDETAEDVIKRALEVVRADGTRIKITEERKRVTYAAKN